MYRLVSEVMTKDVVVLEEWENLLDVARDMKRHHLRHLPVVDGKRLIGLVSHRDLLRYTSTELEHTAVRDMRDSQLKGRTFVREIMTEGIETVRPDTTVAEAVGKLITGRFGCVPVVDADGNLVGIVSEHDLLKLLAEMLKLEQGESPEA